MTTLTALMRAKDKVFVGLQKLHELGYTDVDLSSYFMCHTNEVRRWPHDVQVGQFPAVIDPEGHKQRWWRWLARSSEGHARGHDHIPGQLTRHD